MARDDWFRNHTWSPAIADAFFARLARSKDDRKRAQYLRIQAVELIFDSEVGLGEGRASAPGATPAGIHDEALELLPTEPALFPVTRFKIAAARAVIADAQGAGSEAVRNAREALEETSSADSGLRYHRELGLVGAGYKEMVQWLRKRVAA